ncbi:MAG: hypothetical protein KDC27_09900 [Acidobacteria bacterium]|nr:hypothetical protein [Acidobacteriota bacterium]
MRRVATIVLFGLFASVSGADELAFVGRAVCAGCHAGQARLQAGSGHFAALRRPGEHRLAGRFGTAEPLTRAPGFRFRVESGEDGVAVEATFGEMARRNVVDWAFGAGDQAVTFVSRVDEQWYLEHYWTFYSTTGRYGPTPGHQMTEADDLGQALGVMYRTLSPQTEILRCFRCHSTGPLALGEGFAIEPSEAGVQCETCHGAGGEHAALAAAGKLDAARPAIANPGRLAPDALLEACGQCHRPPAQQPSEIDYRDPWNVRHQPLYLVRSACYRESGALTCMSCHDAHGALVRNDPGRYDAACKSCHATETACGAGKTADCARCHMPKVEPQEGLRFTNHWIGVFPAGEVYLPR